MKKFLLGVIFIIPIVVMVAISAAVTIIATATSPLPSEILIFGEDGVLIKDRDIIEVEITDTQKYIIIEVQPFLIKDDSIEFEPDSESGDGRLRLVRQEKSNRYLIVPLAPGAVSATIRAAANINIVRELTFIINTQEITGVDIYDETGKSIDAIALVRQERVFAEVSPVVALAGYNLSWKSSDTNIVKVTSNGILYPAGRGKAFVSLSAQDKLGNIHTDRILVDTTRALVSSDQIFTFKEITTDWIRSNVLLSESSEISKIDYTNYIISEDGASVQLMFSFCAEEDWDFCDRLDTVYTRHVPYFAEICYLSSGEPVKGVKLASGNPEICGVDGMTLLPKKGGTATLYATFGGKTKSKVITVRDNPAMLSLNLTSADARRGIKMTRVWGLQTYTEGQLVNTFNMKTVEDADVVWMTDDPVKATVSEDGVITFHEASRGRKVVVTASTMVYGRQTGVSRSFTFTILNEDAVNVYSYDDLNEVNARERYVSVLQSDMESPYEITLRNSLYGNGFTVSAEVRKTENQDNMDSIFNISRSETEHYDMMPAIVIEDVVLIGREEADKAVHVGVDCYKTPNKIVLRYIVAKHFHTSLVVSYSNDVMIEGCILGDNNHHGIMLNYPVDQDCHKVVLRNNVLKMSLGPAIAVLPFQFETEAFGKNYLPELILEGFLDVYNWKSIAELGPAFNIFGVEKLDFGGLIEASYLANAINSALESLMQSPEMAHIFYTDSKGDKYACMGIFLLGAMYKQNTAKVTILDKRLTMLPMPLSNVSGAAGMIIDIVNAVTSAKGMPINNTCYLIGYNFSTHEPEIKPGEAVPQNYDLYRRLQAGAQQPATGADEYDVC